MRTLATGVLLLFGGLVHSAELGILAPVMENDQPVQKANASGERFPVVTRLHEGALFEQLQKEAHEGFTATVLALDELAQQQAGARSTTPTWLYLSIEDGGFARSGFWLRDERGERFVADPFVDLVVDADIVRDGGFEEIFAHEMGHVFLRRLLPRLPQGYSRTPHGSLSITDDVTAFDEGFAIHFQGLVRRMTRNDSLRNQDLGLEFKPLLPYWLSNIDRTFRIDGVRRNWFVQAQLTPPGSGDALTRFDQSTLFDTARLKNGNQMLASEGVIATLFYRWLVPGATDKAALLARYGAVFSAFARVNRQPLQADSAVFLDLLDAYRALDAKEGARVMALTIDTTYGATVDAGVAQRIEALAAQGRIGDMEGFVSALKPARAELARLRDTVVQSPEKMRAALGSALWLRTDAVTLNLNTTEREGLLKLPGVDAALADRALDDRRRAGPFRNVEDFATRCTLPAGTEAPFTARLVDMAAAAQRAGTFPRR